MALVFEWDPRKNDNNLGKHRVGFVEAASVFSDPLGKIFTDEKHSSDEEREILVGHSIAKRLLLVSFTERRSGSIRIISARRATRSEQKVYEENIAGD